MRKMLSIHTGLVLALLSGHVLADPPAAIPEMPDQNAQSTMRSQANDAMNTAGMVAKSRAFEKIPAIGIPSSGGIDVAKIAQQYDQIQPHQADKPTLMVFVSMSMPEASLKRLGHEAKRDNAVLVLRGIPGGLAGGWMHGMAAIKPLSATGAHVEINPQLFEKFNINAVPVIALARLDTSSCVSADTTCRETLLMKGDVDIEYALHQWADGSGPLAVAARQHLDLDGKP